MQIEKKISFDFSGLLAESVKIHGHLCAGQVLGVRMSMLGLREIGITDPRGNDRKSLIVFVEMDRCATDAVQSVTGCSLGQGGSGGAYVPGKGEDPTVLSFGINHSF